MLTSQAATAVSLVETSIFRQAKGVAVVGVNLAFVLVAVVYLIQFDKTPAGVVFFGALLGWAAWRLLRRRDSALLAVDVGFVVVGALLEPLIVAETINDVSMSATRAIAYPAIVGAGVVQAKRWSFVATFLIIAGSALGDTLLFGGPSITLLAFPASWAASIWVHGLIQRAAEATDSAAAEARWAELRERVAAARIRFEREHFAILHDTAASTLMLVSDSTGLDSGRLAVQAERDIDVLVRGAQVADSDDLIDLVERIVAVSHEARTPVVVNHTGPIPVPALIASVTAAATREALTNADRHASANCVVIDISQGRLTISDDGVGFDASQQSRGFGLRGSIEGRMRRAGGTGTVTSSPGAGTSVELTWPAPIADPDHKPADTQRVAQGFQYGLTAAHFMVAIEMLVLGFGGPAGIETPMSTIVVAVLFATTGIAALLVRRPSETVRWGWALLVIGLGLVHIIDLPDNQLGATQNWVSISVGWAIVALFTGFVTTPRRVAVASALLIAYWSTSGIVRVVQTPTSEIIEYAGFGLASIATMQVAAISCAWVLADAVEVAERLGAQQHAAATQRAVEEALQRDYRRRFATLTADVVQLLRGVADGSLPIDSPTVRSRARTEYARLRRLFAQADSFDHPLVSRLRPSLDAAADRGVDVTFDLTPLPEEVDERAVSILTDATTLMLDSAHRTARLVVSAADRRVTVSVVADCSTSVRSLIEARLVGCEYRLAEGPDVTWLRVHTPLLDPPRVTV